MKKLNAENFEEVANSEAGPFIIKFSSETCGPCKTMIPVMDALEKKNPGFPIYEVDCGSSPELAGHFGVQGVPNITYCEKREVLYQFTGLTSLADLQYVIDNLNDPYFREYGEFQKAEKKTDWKFYGIMGLVLTLFVFLFIFT